MITIIKKKASYKKYTYTISASSYYANATYKPASSAASYEADASSDTACVTVYNKQRGISCKIPLSHVKLKKSIINNNMIRNEAYPK